MNSELVNCELTLLYFAECPNWRQVDEHLRALADEFPGIVITYQTVTTPEQAIKTNFRGSPTILINGVDPFADITAPVGLSCRVYQTPRGLSGSPTRDQLREVLANI